MRHAGQRAASDLRSDGHRPGSALAPGASESLSDQSGTTPADLRESSPFCTLLRRLAAQSPAVIDAHIESQSRRGRNYLRETIARTVDASDIARALTAAWSAFVEAAGDDPAGWDNTAHDGAATVVDFTRADLSGAYTLAARSSRARTSPTPISAADLTGAHLTDAHLSRANFHHSNLARADLSAADFTGADFTGADLTGSKRPRIRQPQWPIGSTPTSTKNLRRWAYRKDPASRV